MKKIFFMLALLATAAGQNSFAQDGTDRSKAEQLLSLY